MTLSNAYFEPDTTYSKWKKIITIDVTLNISIRNASGFSRIGIELTLSPSNRIVFKQFLPDGHILNKGNTAFTEQAAKNGYPAMFPLTISIDTSNSMPAKSVDINARIFEVGNSKNYRVCSLPLKFT